MNKELTWTSALGERKKLSELDHQHLSNILWFNEIMHKWNRFNSGIQYHLEVELQKRFPGKYDKGLRLEWKPLPIPEEVSFIKERTIVDPAGRIWYKGECIGSLSHIENWENL